jgi:hypothetical protein
MGFVRKLKSKRQNASVKGAFLTWDNCNKNQDKKRKAGLLVRLAFVIFESRRDEAHEVFERHLNQVVI